MNVENFATCIFENDNNHIKCENGKTNDGYFFPFKNRTVH